MLDVEYRDDAYYNDPNYVPKHMAPKPERRFFKGVLKVAVAVGALALSVGLMRDMIVHDEPDDTEIAGIDVGQWVDPPRTEAEPAPTTTTTEAPTTTTTEAVISREVAPGEHLGTMSVSISGPNALQPTITHELFADPRTPQDVAHGVAIDPNTPLLDKGFVWHRTGNLPGIQENQRVDGHPDQMYQTVIAGHRVTDIADSAHGSRVLEDIDQILPGDRLEITYLDGTRLVYEARSNEVLPWEDTSIFDRASTEDTLSIYACHPKGSDSHRFVVQYDRIA